VPDAILLSHQVDIVGLVVCWKRTRRSEVAEALRRLDMHGDKVFGLILNKVAVDHVSDDTFRGYGS
jgi:Mrp family chromosome partitioning ATPase